MDSRQKWLGYYYSLDSVYEILQRQGERAQKKAKTHELFITWVLAKFLESRVRSPHVVGFPSLYYHEQMSLGELVYSKAILDDEDFDTVVANVADLTRPIRVQVKRYMRVRNADTCSLADFIVNKLSRYGNVPELHAVIHVSQDMKLDLSLLARSVKNRGLGVGMVLLFATTKSGPSPLLWELYPNYTGVVWSPDGSMPTGES